MRLRSLMPGQDPAEPNLWPKPSKASAHVETAADRVRVAMDAADRRQADAERLQAEKERREDLEAQYGAQINALTKDEIRELAVECMGEAAGKFATKRLPAIPLPVGVVRDAFLAHFDNQRT